MSGKRQQKTSGYLPHYKKKKPRQREKWQKEREKDAGFKTYSLCRFRNGKVYNCDLSAAQNIGARYFLREYAKVPGCPKLPCTPQRTYSTLYRLVNDLKNKAA